MAWLTQEGFRYLVISNWPKRGVKTYKIFGRILKLQHGGYVKAGVLT
jgi:hypothetical protein